MSKLLLHDIAEVITDLRKKLVNFLNFKKSLKRNIDFPNLVSGRFYFINVTFSIPANWGHNKTYKYNYLHLSNI